MSIQVWFEIAGDTETAVFTDSPAVFTDTPAEYTEYTDPINDDISTAEIVVQTGPEVSVC